MRLSLLLSLGLCLTPIAAHAQSYPLVSRQIADRDLPCFMHTSTSLSLDLSSLCAVPDPVFSVSISDFTPTFSSSSPSTIIPPGSAATGVNLRTGDLIGVPILQGNGSQGNGGGGNGSSGSCRVSSDIASDGSRCGGRAKSEQ